MDLWRPFGRENTAKIIADVPPPPVTEGTVNGILDVHPPPVIEGTANEIIDAPPPPVTVRKGRKDAYTKEELAHFRVAHRLYGNNWKSVRDHMRSVSGNFSNETKGIMSRCMCSSYM